MKAILLLGFDKLCSVLLDSGIESEFKASQCNFKANWLLFQLSSSGNERKFFKNKTEFLVRSCHFCLQDTFAPDCGTPNNYWVMWLSQEDCSSFGFNASPVPGTTSLMWAVPSAVPYWWNWMLRNGRGDQKAHFLVTAFGQPEKQNQTGGVWI